MRALVVYTHPKPDSFTAAVKATVIERLEQAGADIRLIDLYGEGFSPVLTADEWTRYEDEAANRAGIETHCEAIAWCDTLIFVYPTWWYGLPAILKGWLDRVLVPGLAFEMPKNDGDTIGPGLAHIKRLGVFTTCGASWWLTRFVGSPGRRTILRGVRALCARRCRTCFVAHYLMDSSTEASRNRHLERVSGKLARLLAG